MPRHRSEALLLAALLLLTSHSPFSRAAELLLAASQASPALHVFAAKLQDHRPHDRVRLLSSDMLQQMRIPADSRLILLGEQLFDWRRQHTDLPPTLILQVSRLQALARSNRQPLPRNITLLWSDPPVERQMRLIRQLLPHVRRVGVLLSPLSAQLVPELEQAAARQQLLLRTERWDDPRDNRPLGMLLDHSDVLLGLDDPQLFNPLTIKQILLTSYDQRKALIGPTAAFIRAGSLSSSYSSQQDWLDTLDEVLDLPPEQWPAALYTRHFQVISNESVARSLGVEQNNDAQLTRLLRDTEPRR